MKIGLTDNGKIFVAVASFAVLFAWAVFGRGMNGTGVQAESSTYSQETIALGDGAASPAVRIIEYSDFQCPYCSRVVPTLKQIKEAYGDDVEVVFKNFPLSFHANAQKAAEAAECAKDQGVFWEYHDILFANQNALGVSNLKKYATELGLDSEAFNACLDGGVKSQAVQKDFEEGKTRGVTGTPSFFINEQMIVGAQPYEKFAEVIDVIIEVNKAETTTIKQTQQQETKIKEVQQQVPAIKEVSQQSAPAVQGSCGGACGSPTCGAANGGSCGCGG